MYVRNAWYMAGWNCDFDAGAPKALSILGERIVVYRLPDGGVAALEDRCFHRLAPLSLGRCEGPNLRCMYHGVLLSPEGRCLEIPGQELIPPRAGVRAYPVLERHSAIWIWMGAREQADTSLIPEFTGYQDPRWAMTPGRMDYAAPARLIHDNLLDLSHLAYVHRNSFVGGSDAAAKGWLGADTTTTPLPRGVRVTRWMPHMPANPSDKSLATGFVDVWSSYEFLVPGIFLQLTERHTEGTHERSDGHRPDGQPLLATYTCQAVTPITDDQACYFFAYGPQADHADRQDVYRQLALKAFNEDRTMIEAQYRVIRETPQPRPMTMAMDGALTVYDGLMRRLLAEETKGHASSAALRDPVAV